MGGAISEVMSRPALPLWAEAAHDEQAEAASAPRPRRCASVDGFSIHAGTAVSATNRIGLEKLCRHGLRPAFSHERLALAPGGKVVLGLRKPWPTASGAKELVLEPCAFLRRLASLTPPPLRSPGPLLRPLGSQRQGEGSAAAGPSFASGPARRVGPSRQAVAPEPRGPALFALRAERGASGIVCLRDRFAAAHSRCAKSRAGPAAGRSMARCPGGCSSPCAGSSPWTC